MRTLFMQWALVVLFILIIPFQWSVQDFLDDFIETKIFFNIGSWKLIDIVIQIQSRIFWI